jgi:adenosine deaminase
VRAVEDPSLVDLLAARRIPLGVCPSSNLALGLYPTLDAHPVEALRRAGVLVSLNTDDPSLLGTSLPREYQVCRLAFGWDEEVVREVARTSIEASFAGPEVKARLLADLGRW